jgi:DNA polymerase III epsilon subunit family exonuclease
MNNLKINKPCPSCKKEGTIEISKTLISCTNPECDFSINVDCPICNSKINDCDFIAGKELETFCCNKCKNTIQIKRIAYLIENSLVVDQDNRCSLCNCPTIHRADMNLSNRCFFFPMCSGQGDLFGIEKESLVFLDFETTGLDPGNNHIIEIGALKMDEEGYDHTYQTLIKPPVPIGSEITRITGITDEMVENSPNIEPCLQKLIEFIGDAKLVAHNADFDMPWLALNALRNNIELKNNKVICTLKWAKLYNEPRASLTALTKKYSIPQQNAHRALADAIATRELFFIYENLKEHERPTTKLTEYVELSKKITSKYHTI